MTRSEMNEHESTAEKSSVHKKEEAQERTRKREKKAMREVSPVCEYERIRATNIAERMEFFRTLDIDGAVVGGKE